MLTPPLSTLLPFPPLLLLLLSPTPTTSTIITSTSTSTITATTAPTSPSTAISTSTSPQYTSSPTFQSSILNSTNTYRTQHNATSLSWNDTLATYALTWAQKCQWQHSHGPYGENLAENYQNVTDAVDGWGDERKFYDFANGGGGFSEQTGHFTQLVWKATTSVGCGRVDCGEGGANGAAQGWFVVCEYYSAGNVEGEYAAEVQGEIGKAMGKGEAVEYVDFLYGRIHGSGADRRGVEGWWWLVGFGLVIGKGIL